MDGLTRHHLIPRTRHHNRRTKRDFDREEMQARILWLCRPCHNQVHVLFSEKQLANEYNTREALLADAELQRFVQWIGTKPAGFKPRSRSPRR